jgi:hypothetical protein
MTDLAVTRSKKTKRWIKSRFGAGLCSTLTWDELELYLHNNNRVKENEYVDRFEVSENGITFFIEPVQTL